MGKAQFFYCTILLSSLNRTKMAPCDTLLTKDRNIDLRSKSEMLFESMRKCHIPIPLEILLILDQKISKFEPEMAELALFGGTIEKEDGHRSLIHSFTSLLIFCSCANPFNNWLILRVRQAHFLTLPNKNGPLGPIIIWSFSQRLKCCSNRCINAVFEFLSKFYVP